MKLEAKYKLSDVQYIYSYLTITWGEREVSVARRKDIKNFLFWHNLNGKAGMKIKILKQQSQKPFLIEIGLA